MTSIQTFSGRMVDVARIKHADLCLADIARPLSRLARFLGHTRDFYSVAQHSVIVSIFAIELARQAVKDGQIPEGLVLTAARMGLLHDAHEAYTGDTPSPLKALTGSKLDDARGGIDRVVLEWAGIHLDYGVSEHLHAIAKQADVLALATERRDLMDHVLVWGNDPGVGHTRMKIAVALDHAKACAAFIARYDALFGSSAAWTGKVLLGDDLAGAGLEETVAA